MKDGDTQAHAGAGREENLRTDLGAVRDPLIVRASLASSFPSILVRPNDPLIAADVRAMAHEIIAECLEAGSAEIVSEVAMPLQAHALARMLHLSADHADEWISWGIDGLDYAEEALPPAAPCVTDYVDRQLSNARRSRESDFFAALDRLEIGGLPVDFDGRRRLAVQLLSDGRARVVAVLAAALDWLAADRRKVSRLRSDPVFAERTVDGFLGALPVAAGDSGLPSLPGRQHARLLLRALLAVIAVRVERLTVERRQPRTDAHPLELHSLLVAFMPRDADG